LAVDIAEALFEVVPVDGPVEMEETLERRRDAREVFFCSGGGGWLALDDSDDTEDFFCSVGGGWLVLDSDVTEGFLRSCSVDAGERSCDWPPEDLSTGSRDVGRGIPDRTGMPDVCWSMVVRGLNGQYKVGLRATQRSLRVPCPTRGEAKKAPGQGRRGG
jgi:hypothetical protein